MAYNYHFNDHPPPYEHHHEEEHSAYHETPSSGKPIHYEFHSVSDSADPQYNRQKGNGGMVFPDQQLGMKEKYPQFSGVGTNSEGGGGGQSKEGEECSDEEEKVGREKNVMYQYKEEMLKPMMLPIMTNQDELGEEEGHKMVITKPSKNPFTRGRQNRKYPQEGVKYQKQFMQMMKYEHQNESPQKYPKEQEKPMYQQQMFRQSYPEQGIQSDQYALNHEMFHGMKMETADKEKKSEEVGEEIEKPSSEEVSMSSSEFLDKNDKESGSSKEKYKTVTTSYFPYVQGADYKNQRSYNDDTMSKDDIDKYADIYK